MALFFATRNSHAEGLSGMPFSFQTLIASIKVCCTTSSAVSRFCVPKIFVKTETIFPDSCRNRWSVSLLISKDSANLFQYFFELFQVFFVRAPHYHRHKRSNDFRKSS